MCGGLAAGLTGVDIREHERAVPGHRSTPSDLGRDALRSGAGAAAAAAPAAAAARCDAVALPFCAVTGAMYGEPDAPAAALPSRAPPRAGQPVAPPMPLRAWPGLSRVCLPAGARALATNQPAHCQDYFTTGSK